MVRNYTHVFLSYLSIDSAISAGTDLLGKSVTDLQSDVTVHADYITGSLKYVTGYTGFSGDASLQSGNYLVLHADAPSGSTITAEVIGGTSAPVTLDADGLLIARIASKNQQIKFTATKSGLTQSRTFHLANLVLEDS